MILPDRSSIHTFEFYSKFKYRALEKATKKYLYNTNKTNHGSTTSFLTSLTTKWTNSKSKFSFKWLTMNGSASSSAQLDRLSASLNKLNEIRKYLLNF